MSALTDIRIDVERYMTFLAAEWPRLAGKRLYADGWPMAVRRAAVLDRALDGFARRDGIGLEFGVYQGASLRRMSRRFTRRNFHGFDSFEGFPADGRRDWNLDFSTIAPPRFRSNVQLWPGWFSDTLPQFLAASNAPIGFVHIDCDLYSSTREVLFGLADRIGPGTVLCFDELLNYDTFLWNELLALFEFLELTGLGVEWIALHQKLRPIDETLALLDRGVYPRWDRDVADGYHRQAALVLTSGADRTPCLGSEAPGLLAGLCDQFLAVGRNRTALNLANV